MSDTGPPRIAVDIELPPEGTAISGSTHDGQGHTAQFEGWLGLIALVEQARGTEHDHPE